MSADARQGVVILAIEGALAFIPIHACVKVMPIPDVTRVPGAPSETLGVALVDREIIPIVAIGAAREELLICAMLGERVGIVGHEMVETGLHEVRTDGTVAIGDRVAKPLDLPGIYARVREAGAWLTRGPLSSP